ncbi:hypothetical protein AAGS61_01830 [Lysinibacillus sp. KU-BSD001]|uniref:hypothetical protein n=1 Tax=Lysinibacillus sp. KU-BSD001 TaxID=3141328 RepID=UPI0036EE3AB6
MDLPNRVYYNQEGKIVFMTGELRGATEQHLLNEEINYIEIPFGTLDYSVSNLVGVNVDTKQLIIETIEKEETEEQKRIRELEDALLLQAENEVGGIL